MTNKELWEKAQVWDSSDDGRGKLKILESVEKFAALIRADEREACADAVVQAVEKGLQAAIAMEREACAVLAEKKICDTHIPTGINIYGTRAAKAIRARATK